MFTLPTHSNQKVYTSLAQPQEEIQFQQALADARENPKETARTISKYNLSEEHRFVVADLIQSIEPGSGVISQNIESFNLSSYHRYILAEKELMHMSSEVLDNIENYHIEEEEKRFELAKIAIVKGPYVLPEHLYKFKLSDDHIFQIAKLGAETNGRLTSKVIKEYRLKKEGDRYQIAEIAVIAEVNMAAKREMFKLLDETLKCLDDYNLRDFNRSLVESKVVSILKKRNALEVWNSFIASKS